MLSPPQARENYMFLEVRSICYRRAVPF